MSICVLSMAYGDYWNEWGNRWIENLESLNPQPDRIMLLSDDKKNVPSWVENIVLGRRHMSQYANVGAQIAETDWMCWHGLDDLYLNNAFTPFDESGDVYSYPHVLGGIREGMAQYNGGYETMYNLIHQSRDINKQPDINKPQDIHKPREYTLIDSLPLSENTDIMKQDLKDFLKIYCQLQMPSYWMQANVCSIADGEGLCYDLSETQSGNTRDAHRLLLWAETIGKQDPLLEAMYSAYFEKKQSLFTHDDLLSLINACGIDQNEAQDVLNSNRYHVEFDADIALARQLGITGVPFYAVDMRYGISGAQPDEVFFETLKEAIAHTDI
ncbi:MAG: DsbA family oxidoreductase [Actinobacteria bacterium]|nr:DsbA family oxidoreductase [Actinomycetota bacterium]